jgi:hypothetical protein
MFSQRDPYSRRDSAVERMAYFMEVKKWLSLKSSKFIIPSRFKPTIKYFVDALQNTFSLLRRYSDLVDLFSVNVGNTLDA